MFADVHARFFGVVFLPPSATPCCYSAGVFTSRRRNSATSYRLLLSAHAPASRFRCGNPPDLGQDCWLATCHLMNSYCIEDRLFTSSNAAICKSLAALEAAERLGSTVC